MKGFNEKIKKVKKNKLAIVGSGSLGSIIAKVVSQNLNEEYEISGILSGQIKNAISLAEEIGSKAYKSLEEIIDDKPDYVIEAASPDVFKDIGVKFLANGINLIPLSVEALADTEFYNKVKETALENNSRVHIPSGAVGGFDVLMASMAMEKAEVSIATEKSPQSLNGPIFKGKKTFGGKSGGDIQWLCAAGYRTFSRKRECRRGNRPSDNGRGEHQSIH